MIEITHEQARRWARQALDLTIREAHWSALQAHLETCAECRAYRDARLALEKSLRRDINAGWTPVDLPPGLPAGVTGHLRRRAAQRGLLARAAVGLCVLLAAAGLLWRFAGPTAIPAAQPQAGFAAALTATPEPSPTPAYAGNFRGVLAFEAPAQDGLPIPAGAGQARPAHPEDIFLLALNTGSAELTNLTHHPAADFAPAWSPDGNWLAFLSQREREQGADIYLISVAGSGLTRLTHDTSLSFRGPLAWAPDGSWIAAAGGPVNEADARREAGIYRIAADASRPPAPLPNSAGGYAPRFAPNRGVLAFIIQEGELTFLRAFDQESGQMRDLTRANAQVRTAAGAVSLGVTAFDWSADGREILYLSRPVDPITEPASTLVRVVEVGDFPTGGASAPDLSAALPTRLLASFPTTAPVVSATLSPGGELLFTRTFRRFGRGPRCRPLATPHEMVSSGQPGAGPGPLRLPALCLEGGIERASWTSDGRWVVFGAQVAAGAASAGAASADEASADEASEVESAGPGIYALALPGRGQRQRVAVTERLADLPAGAGTPRVRPSGAPAGARLELAGYWFEP